MKDSVAEFFEKYGDDEQILKLALIDRAPKRENDSDDDGPPRGPGPGGPGGGAPRGKHAPADTYGLPEIDSLDPFAELGVVASPMLRLTGDDVNANAWNAEVKPPLPPGEGWGEGRPPAVSAFENTPALRIGDAERPTSALSFQEGTSALRRSPHPNPLPRGEGTGPALRLVTETSEPVSIEPPAPALHRPTILHVRVVAGTGGGPEKTILRSPKYAHDDIYNMAVAYIHPKGDSGIEVIKANAKKWDAPIITIPERGAFSPSTLVALYRLCKKLNVSVWHAHDYKSNLFGLMLRRFWKMKLVTTVHGWTNDTFRTRLYYHVDKWCLPRYDEVIAVSPTLMEHCIEIGVHPQKVTYIHNAIEPREFRRQHTIKDARYQLGVWPGAIVMGVVGRLSVEKGVDRAIDTLAALAPKYPKLELHIVGDGPEYDRLKKQAEELGVSEKVTFWGWQSDSRRFFETFDFLLLPSHTEGYPNVVLEAMSMRVPVAAADVGGVSELLKCGRRGVILDAKDASTWAGHIAPLIVSQERRTELARLGRLRIKKYYAFAQRMHKVFSIYDRMLSIDPQREETAWRRAA